MTAPLLKKFNEAAAYLRTAIRTGADLSPANKRAETSVLDIINTCIDATDVAQEAFSKMKSEDVSDLRRAFMTADREMEKYWAQKIIESVPEGENLSWGHFDIYPWFKDYPALYEFEKKALENVYGPINENTHIVYVGSGALPIIPMMLHEDTGCRIDCLDIHAPAVDISNNLINRKGMDEGVSVHLSDGDFQNTARAADIVFLANAPLGARDEMIALLDHFKPFVVFARSSGGGTAMLYPEADRDSFVRAGYENKLKATDHEHGTHTALVYKKSGIAL